MEIRNAYCKLVEKSLGKNGFLENKVWGSV
jgi:hypothetical protein